MYNAKNEMTDAVFCNEMLSIQFKFNYGAIDVSRIIFTIGIKDQTDELIAFFSSDEMGFTLNGTSNTIVLTIPQLGLRPGDYSIWLFASYNTTAPSDFCDVVNNSAQLTVLPVDFWKTGKMIRSRNAAFLDAGFLQTGN
jgi:hypothetical protein